jgi:dTDP-4-amino-4,6-dideoxygalactose transaminase
MFHLLRQSNQERSYREIEGRNIRSYLPQSDDYSFASTGRSLINLLIRRLKLTENDTCLMPSYVAEGVLFPFVHNGVKVRFYKVDEKLFADLQALEQQIKNDSSIKLLVLIHPFGFEQPVKPIKKLLTSKHIHLLEDCAQALFCKDSEGSLLGRQGEFALFSLNKYLPVPDGAILQSYLPAIKVTATEFKPEDEARTISIKDYNRHLHHNFELLQCDDSSEAQTILEKTSDAYERYYAFINRNLNLYAPCEETWCRLKTIDFEAMITQRITNTRYLYDNLKSKTFRFVYETWDENSVPMTVPVYVDPEQREQIVSTLFDRNVLLSTLIDKWDFIPEHQTDEFLMEKQYIDSHLLTPVNEFLSINQMGKMVEILNEI